MSLPELCNYDIFTTLQFRLLGLNNSFQFRVGCNWFLAIFFFFNASVLFSQDQRELQILTSKPFYISGEQIELVLTNPQDERPTIYYVELIDGKNEVISRTSLKGSETLLFGQLAIPLNTNSAWYHLRAYSLWMPSVQPRDIAYFAVPIYNEFDSNPATTEPSKQLIQTTESFLATDFEKYNTRSSVKASILLEKNTEDYWITTLESEIVATEKHFRSVLPSPSYSVSFPKHLDEDRPQTELIFLGRVKADVQDKLVAVYIVEDRKIYWTAQSEDDLFSFFSEDFIGDKNARLLTYAINGEVDLVDAEQIYPSATFAFPEFITPSLPYPAEVVSSLVKSRQRRIINDIYNITDLSESTRSETVEFIKPDRSYRVDDYIQFKKTDEFIREVATSLRIRKTDNITTFHTLLSNKAYSLFPSFTFLNGHLVDDASKVLEIDLTNIDRIDIYRNDETIRELFGSIGRNGAVAIYTKDLISEVYENEIVLLGINQRKKSMEESTEHPRLDPILYNNLRESDDVGAKNLTFFTNDHQGHYNIVMRYLDSNGKIKLAINRFEVKN